MYLNLVVIIFNSEICWMKQLFKGVVMKRAIGICCLVFFITGCASFNYTKQSVNYQERIPKVKKIAVMPIDFKMFRVNTGGTTEEIDEWTQKVKANIKQSLQKSLGTNQIEVKFVDETTLKNEHYDLWFSQKGLFEAVATSALNHAYPGYNAFEDKIKNFDYTLGVEVEELSKVVDADALLFIQGFDTIRSTGRFWMEVFQAAVVGVYYTYYSNLKMGLVDGKTGDLLWFKFNNILQERDYRNEKQVEKDIKWFTEDLLKKN